MGLPSFTQPIHPSKYCLLTLAAGLVAIHFTLVLQTNLRTYQGTSLVFWAAIASLLWDRRNTLIFKSNLLASLVGLLLLAILLLGVNQMPVSIPFLRVMPPLALVSVGLLASGFQGLRQYQRELLVLVLMVLPSSPLETVLDIAPLTAQVATAMVWLMGFEVTRQGTQILLPQGGVLVDSGCAGIQSIFLVLQFAGLALILFPTHRNQKIWLPILAVVIAFAVNSARVTMLALLSSPHQKAAFEYWHGGAGSPLFSTIAVAIFGAICYFWLLHDDDLSEDDSVPAPHPHEELSHVETTPHR